MFSAEERYYDSIRYSKSQFIDKPVDIWNHFNSVKSGTVYCSVYDCTQKHIFSETQFEVGVLSYSFVSQRDRVKMAAVAGSYRLSCEIKDGSEYLAWSPLRYLRIN